MFKFNEKQKTSGGIFIMKHNFLKKLTSLLLGVIMVVAMIPVVAIGSSASVAGTSVTYTFSSYTEGTQYAVDEVHVLDDYVTVTTTQAHFTEQLRLYSSSTHDGYAVFASALAVDSIVINAGHKTDTLNVYSSTDGNTWSLVQGVAITSTSYNDYTVDLPDETTYIKLDVQGTQQIRIAYVTMTFAAAVVGAHEHEYAWDGNMGANGMHGLVCANGDGKCTVLTRSEECEWDAGTETKPATCTSEGEITHTCTVCGVTKIVAVPVIPHNFVSGSCADCGVPAATYTKVTTDLADWSGTYLIVYEAGSLAFDGSLATLDAVQNTVPVSISSGKIVGDYSAYVFTIAAIDGGYTIKSASGYYIGRSAGTNGLDSSTNYSYTNTISVSGGNAAIIGSGNAQLCYNKTSGQERFRYFKSASQQPIALYKLDDGTAVAPAGTKFDKDDGLTFMWDIPADLTGLTAKYTVNGGAPVSINASAAMNINVPAKQYFDVIEVTLYNGDTAVAAQRTSVAAESEKVLDNTAATEAAKDFAQATINLGAVAKDYFKYEGGTVSGNKTPDGPAEALNATLVTTGSPIVGIDYTAFNVRADEKFILRHHFNITGSGNYTVTVGGVPMSPKKVEGTDNEYYVEAEFVVGDFGTAKTVVISDGANTYTVDVSIYSYIAAVLADEAANSDLVDVAKALYDYNEAAAKIMA